MNALTRALLGAALITLSASSALSAQHLHLNNRWKECSFVIDPSLTPEAWHQFVSEAGLVTYIRPLASARPLGAKRRHGFAWTAGLASVRVLRIEGPLSSMR